MRYFPFEKFCIITRLNPYDVQSHITQEISNVKRNLFTFNLFSSSDAPSGYFEGKLTSGKFHLKPIVNYRNSFLPEINGSIEPYKTGSKLYIKMAPNPAVVVFLCVWFGFATIAALVMIIQSVVQEKFIPSMLIPLGLMLFGYLLTLGGFKFESNDAKNKLEQIVAGRILENCQFD